nr:MAG TPA: hypothetical protein [Caudoviricetes sp.]
MCLPLCNDLLCHPQNQVNLAQSGLFQQFFQPFSQHFYFPSISSQKTRSFFVYFSILFQASFSSYTVYSVF